MPNVITKENSKYPALLQKISDAPEQLYYKGDWNGMFSAQGGPALGGENCLAVVGTRKMTSYGRRVTEQIVGEIAAAGITIVSGFMYGVDATAHKAALMVGGKTIAVMPCGIERVHPEHQKDLYEEVVGTGLVISEWEGSMPPARWMYPSRNRIVAGLSKATLVVEAGSPSGSLITAHLTLQYGRKLFAVPGPITSSVSKGTIELLKDGAGLVSEARDVLDFFKMEASYKRPVKEASADGVEGQILEKLHQEPLEIDVLARNLALPAAEIGTTLSMMQINGLIEEDNGKYYVN